MKTARDIVHGALAPDRRCAFGRNSANVHGVLCNALTSALEADRRETLRYLAAYLLDRGDQQDTDGGKWVPLADAAYAIAEGEFVAAWKHGEIDEGDVLERVDKWFARVTAAEDRLIAFRAARPSTPIPTD